ncbi:MAG TPA: DNA methyltransferase, partial [Ktedonobacterales bacterium]|nr:DNA methyltransferase [Ktedonobacterales bacterium]
QRIKDVELAARLAFVFTSLYQRVTRLSEFRFWGGSGNTPRYNVPFIFNEANVFVTFARKARTIQDHLLATAAHYQGQAVVVQQSATHLDSLPDTSVDLIFTDPPFGANINYSEMNFLWESWLQRFTETQDEAIVNSVQGKTLQDYQRLMTQSLSECYRVLRPGYWMLLVFMNSSAQVWEALRTAISEAGFVIRKADVFDKQHATFKQLVSENTAGCELVLHCWKPTMTGETPTENDDEAVSQREAIFAFLAGANVEKRRQAFLHVSRPEETDFRSLYSEWLIKALTAGEVTLDFAQFRLLVLE